MRIIFNEVKKILNIKSIFVLCIISFVMYYMFISSEINLFPSRGDEEIYTIAKEMIKQKGNHLEDEDLGYLKNLELNFKKEADNYLKENEYAKELGADSYDKFQEFNSNLKGEVKKLDELSNNISFKEIEESLSKIRSMGYFIDNFENKDNNSYIESGAQKDRLTEINKTKVNNDILPWFIFDNYNSFIINTTLLVIVSIIFILGPIFTKDEVVNMEVLQYTTRRGRRLYKDKIAAVLISAFIMVTLELSILFTLFLTRQNTVELFYNSNINSCFKYGANWFDLTLIQYIILSIIIVYILAFALALIISYVSRKSHRYITFTGISLLIVIILSKIITSNTIMLGIGSIDIPRFLVFGFISAMVLIGVVSLEVRYKKEKLLDIF
ncbi:hypothetical protein [Clostridium algidicarnis]|uniref:ABC-2 family transporter n=2 Tax=Clostridium algidicarnis TaxID=37659 RepID=A0A2S6FXZ0_9CLOT|nr:hypothetical protein [Clostridium algidicarnis]MBU3220072.1 hypothetical protein [Clostridium algidicarnis]MCB2285823.1 hypothetical protein [Clostridium algidicarnis]PPK48473.1 hypothetical protein BD821_107112 [Clostridium algidicarnis DSM 15099]